LSERNVQLVYAHTSPDPADAAKVHWAVSLLTCVLTIAATGFALAALAALHPRRARGGGSVEFYSIYTCAFATLGLLWSIGRSRATLVWNIIILTGASTGFALAWLL
jgi:hypothetical protein